MSLILEKQFVVLHYFPAFLNSCEIVRYWTSHYIQASRSNKVQ